MDFTFTNDGIALDLPPDPPTLREVVESLVELGKRGTTSSGEDLSALMERATQALEHDERLRFRSGRPLGIKRFIAQGEIQGDCRDLADLYDWLCSLLDRVNSHDIFGTVLFEGEDGRAYGAWVEAVVGLASPDFVKDTIEVYGEEDED